MNISIDSLSYRLELLYQIAQVPMSVFKDNTLVSSYPFYECGYEFTISPSLTPSLLCLAQKNSFYNIDNNSLAYSIIPVDEHSQYYVFAGPVRIQRNIDVFSYHTSSQLFSDIPLQICENILSMVPMMNMVNFLFVLQLLYHEIKGVKISINDMLSSDANPTTIDKANQILFRRREASVYHHSYIGELLICDIIRNGQIHRLPTIAKFIASKGVPGTIHSDPVRNMKDLAIITITIIARPAIQGGLSDEIAFSMSDTYMHEIEASEKVKDIYNICIRAVSEYTYAVAKLKKNQSLSTRIKRCINYLQKNLHNNIIIDNIAGELNVSTKYLSIQFKKELGISISDYIQRERINEAKSLLAFTDFSYIEIGNYLNFSSQSYFITVFKKVTGTTPAVYRKQHYSSPLVDTVNISIAEYIKRNVQQQDSTYIDLS